MHILIVDHDPVFRRAVGQMLPRFRVDAVGHADRARLAFEQTAYHAMVIDYGIDGGSQRMGVELAAAARRRRRDAGIVLTYAAQESELQALAGDMGIDAVLSRDDLQGSALRGAIEAAVSARTGISPGIVEEVALPSDLRSLLADARDAVAEGELVQARAAYRIGLVARATSSDARLGRQCARALGLTRHTLLAYALLASRFSAADLREYLVARCNVHGERITVSHLQQLALLPRRARQVWIERTYSEALTVRELRAAVTRMRSSHHAER